MRFLLSFAFVFLSIKPPLFATLQHPSGSGYGAEHPVPFHFQSFLCFPWFLVKQRGLLQCTCYDTISHWCLGYHLLSSSSFVFSSFLKTSTDTKSPPPPPTSLKKALLDSSNPPKGHRHQENRRNEPRGFQVVLMRTPLASTHLRGQAITQNDKDLSWAGEAGQSTLLSQVLPLTAAGTVRSLTWMKATLQSQSKPPGMFWRR